MSTWMYRMSWSTASLTITRHSNAGTGEYSAGLRQSGPPYDCPLDGVRLEEVAELAQLRLRLHLVLLVHHEGLRYRHELLAGLCNVLLCRAVATVVGMG